jgi:hypothetical protein
VARDGRLETEPESTVGKPATEPDRGPVDLEHTQPMEHADATELPDAGDTSYIGASLPRIEQLPPTILVEEGEMGHATGQWIVQIRCDCGRRWFDVKMVKTARCPRCESMVVIESIDD